MKLERIYKVTDWYTIISAVPYRETDKQIIFSGNDEANGYRMRVLKNEYMRMPRSPQEAIDQHRAILQKKISGLENETRKLNDLEQETKNE